VAKTFRKYGKAVPANILAAAENNDVVTVQDDTGSDPAVPSDQYDSSYLSPVTVGSNTLHLDFDTGSADL
jgi:aspergillopepsin I